ncbi:MAG: fluoride efflux transporter CrcB [Deltaproteobacteria bacterium]|nr:fluoride efflux transporter CrcB [Deltaproteobacteria bacterium]
MIPFVAVGIGGAIGAVLRYAITLMMFRLCPLLPLGTFFSNIIAGFLCGIIVYLNKNSSLLNPVTAIFLTTGMMGGLSTFSTFSVETVDLLKNSRYLLASVNIIANLALSILSVILGIQVAKKFIL